MRTLRSAWGVPVGLPATKWTAEIGAFALRSDTGLLLNSRRVVPDRLTQADFGLQYPHWAGPVPHQSRDGPLLVSGGNTSCPADRSRLTRNVAFGV